MGGATATHPGGNALFCHAGHVERSRKRSRTTGHQSLEMQRRYQHLTPQVKSQAVLAVFG
jgi:hypothetical protein